MTESEDTRLVAGEGGHAVPRPGPPGTQGPGAGTSSSPRPEAGAGDDGVVEVGADRSGGPGQPGQEPAEDAAGPRHDGADREASEEADRDAAGREATDDGAEVDSADEDSAGQGPDPGGEHGQEAADVVRLELPARDSTGDPAVDEALTAFDRAQGADLASHVRAAEAVHEALQRRLGDAHS